MERVIQPCDLKLSLRSYTPLAYTDAVAAARTCYSMDVITPEQVTEKQKDYIGPLTYNAGHHTVYQHATFEFGLENVSRHFVWSVLHSFPYYNSDQQSQRYVRLDKIRAFIPASAVGQARQVYEAALLKSFKIYDELTASLLPITRSTLHGIRRLNERTLKKLHKKADKEAEKKAIEIARYVLPIATHTSMVYTVSGLVLHRLYRLMNTGDVSEEAQKVIGSMVQEARKVDPDFFQKIGDDPLDSGAAPEDLYPDVSMQPDVRQLDQRLDGKKFSKLLDASSHPREMMELSLRAALGQRYAFKSMDDAIDAVLNPHRNRLRVEKTNLSTHSALMRPLDHIRYTFFKRLSHSADSQNQRHRTTPGSRPQLSFIATREPDFYTPMLIERDENSLQIYRAYMNEIWETFNQLIGLGMPLKDAMHILPNALHVRFVESGSLLNLMHKWTLRTCLNAQEEIYQASMEELAQVRDIHPYFAKYMGPPCTVRNGVVSPRCTEGDRYCGLPVWKQFPNVDRQL